MAEFPLVYDYDGREFDTTKDAFLRNVYLERENGIIRIRKRPSLRRVAASSGSYKCLGLAYTSNAYGGDYYAYTLRHSAGTTWNVDRLAYNGALVNLGTITLTSNDNMMVATKAANLTADIVIGALYGVVNAWGVHYTGPVINSITDADFPDPLRGLVELDGYIFAALTSTGAIYNSSVDDYTAWAATDFIYTNSSPHVNRLFRHKDHLVAFGNHSIEFFYNAANPTGSPLSLRRDLHSNIATMFYSSFSAGKSFYSQTSSGDDITFIGIEDGVKGIYVLQDLQIRKISTPAIDRAINTITGVDFQDIYLTWLEFYNKRFIVATIETYSFVYDLEFGMWYKWDTSATAVGSSNGFPVASYVTFSFVDSKVSMVQCQDGHYYELLRETYQDYNGTTSSNYTCEIQTPNFIGGEGEQDKRKFINWIKLSSRGAALSTAPTITIKTDDYATSSSLGTLQPDGKTKLNRLGYVYEAAFNISHSANEDFTLEKMYIDYSVGTN